MAWSSVQIKSEKSGPDSGLAPGDPDVRTFDEYGRITLITDKIFNHIIWIC
jgi:hypothetical protein